MVLKPVLVTWVANSSRHRDIFTTGTYKNDINVLRKAIDLHNNNIEKAKGHVKSDYWAMDVIIQPWPKLFAQHSVEKGGNVLGLERFDENLIRM